MMVHCGKCGAELLGAVNRCWKCGQTVVSRPDATTVPPLRRPPVSGPLHVAPWEALSAVILDLEPVATPAEPSGAAAVAAAASVSHDDQPALDTVAPRRGSPFAHGASLRKSPASASRPATRPADLRVKDASSPLEVERPQSALERWTPIAAICLGAGAFGLGDYPEVALGFAVIGMAFGIAAVLSRVKLTSVAGILICVAALLWSGYSTAVAVYERTFGVSPWTSMDDDFEPTPLDDTVP